MPNSALPPTAENLARDLAAARDAHIVACRGGDPAAQNRTAEAWARSVNAAKTGAVELADALVAVAAERDKLAAFKAWTHAYLDAHGVPHHPPGPHGAEGCRIGDRMDWLMDRLADAQAKLAEYDGTAARLVRAADRMSAAEARVRLLEAALRYAEWRGTVAFGPPPGGWPACPWCEAMRSDGHSSGCAYVAALAPPSGPAEDAR